MAEADIASLDDFQGNDCSFVAHLLKSKGLHKLYYVFGLGLESFINVWPLLNFPGVEAFDHLKWTYYGSWEFEQSFLAELSPVRAIDNFVYMMTSSKCRPGTILENLYPPQNFVPVFLYTAVWSLESQFPWKRTDGASIQGNQKWRRLKCAEEMCIRSRTVAPKLSSERLTCYEAKGNLR